MANDRPRTRRSIVVACCSLMMAAACSSESPSVDAAAMAQTSTVADTPTTTRAFVSPTTTDLADDPRSKVDCQPHSIADRTQRSLAIDPTNHGIVYVGVERQGFFKSVDGGATWRRAQSGLKAWKRSDGTGLCFEEFYETVIDAANPNDVCIARAGGPGLSSTVGSTGTNGVYCSSDAGVSWVQRISPTMNTAVYALAADPNDARVMYAGVNGGPCSVGTCPPNTYFNTIGAIYKTNDGGLTWKELDSHYLPDMRVTALRVDPSNPNVVVAATFSKIQSGGAGNFAGPQSGLLRSVDGGASWTASTQGMSSDPREQALLFMELSPRNASNVFVTASSNTSYTSSDGGLTFSATKRMTAVAFDPNDPSGRHVIGCSGDRIMESRDAGRTWSDLTGTPAVFSVPADLPTDFEWSRQDPLVIYMSGGHASVFRSNDGGHSWTGVLSSETLPGV